MGTHEWEGLLRECGRWWEDSAEIYWRAKDWQDERAFLEDVEYDLPEGVSYNNYRRELLREDDGLGFSKRTARIATWIGQNSNLDPSPLWAVYEELEAMQTDDWEVTPGSVIRAVRLAKRLVDRIIDRETATPESPAEQRNRWIYHECRAGIAYESIMRELSTKPTNWERIYNAQGISAAAKRYAKKHNLPLPKTRQRGRPTKQKEN